MKTYEQERNELIDWMKAKTEEYIKAMDEDTSTGRDSKLDKERRQVVLEYNRKLAELKKKYNIETKKEEPIEKPQESDLGKRIYDLLVNWD